MATNNALMNNFINELVKFYRYFTKPLFAYIGELVWLFDEHVNHHNKVLQTVTTFLKLSTYFAFNLYHQL